MYSTASPPPKKEGAKSITPSGIKRGKTANRMATPVCILPDHSSGRNIRTEKRQDFLPLFCAERRRFGEDISNPCRRHTETLHYSLFTLHFYHPKLCEGKKPRHTRSVFMGRQRIAARRAQAEPGRSSARTDYKNALALCPRRGSDRKRKAAGFPAAFLLCLLRLPVSSATIQTGVAIRLAVFPLLILKG